MTPLNVDLLKQSIVQRAQNDVIDVVIELSRLDQRLAGIADSIPLPDDCPIELPRTAPEYLSSTIKSTRQQFPEMIGLLKSAAQETNGSLWLAFTEERLAETSERRFSHGRAPIAKYLAAQYGESNHELVGALYLDAGHRLIADVKLCRGTRSRVWVNPRVVLGRGLLLGAVALVLWHTHPSGDSKPSDKDLRVTKDLAQAAAVVGLRLVDHLIIARGGECTSIGGLN